MNKVIIMGRLVKDPVTRYTPSNGKEMAISRYTLAVSRRKGDEADYISCVAFGSNGEFAEKYLKKGTKIALSGRLQTGSYTNAEGTKVYTVDIVVEEQEFAESKKGSSTEQEEPPACNENGFMNIPDGIQEELPFH